MEVLSEPHPTGGWQQARRERVQMLLAEDDTAWCPDQYSNPDNVTGYHSLGMELIAQLRHIDVLVCSVGTGGHSAGVAHTLRQFNPDLQVVGVDTIGSTIFGQPAQSRIMRGLGSSIYPRNVDYDLFSEVHWVAPAEAVWACRTLAATHYATGGWSVGAVALVSGWLARTRPVGTQIAAIFPDGPARYYGTIYNDEYCQAHDLVGRPPRHSPLSIDHPSNHLVTQWTRCATVVDPTSTL